MREFAEDNEDIVDDGVINEDIDRGCIGAGNDLGEEVVIDMAVNVLYQLMIFLAAECLNQEIFSLSKT